MCEMSSCMEYPEVFPVDLDSLPPDRETELQICLNGRSDAYRQSIVSAGTGGDEIDDDAAARTDIGSKIKGRQEETLDEQHLESERMVGALGTLGASIKGAVIFWKAVITSKACGYTSEDSEESYRRPGMKKDIAHFVERCVACFQVKIERQRPCGNCNSYQVLGVIIYRLRRAECAVRIRQSVAQLGQDQMCEMSSCMEYPEVFPVDLDSLPPDRETELQICLNGRSDAYRQSIVSAGTGGDEIDDDAAARTDIGSKIKGRQEETLDEQHLESERMVGALGTLGASIKGAVIFWKAVITSKACGYTSEDSEESYRRPGMKKDIAHFVERCVACFQVKIERQRPCGNCNSYRSWGNHLPVEASRMRSTCHVSNLMACFAESELRAKYLCLFSK
ncbi:hypothetical protein OSB04_024601 [Centaurea solstitialis]|uniref:Uncharacterized protein n=1 Tax=Centaurea solstitialis TaxID=347529 RepID=A0AA38WC85_9ASTR|nr:hypothetical protein OSB04_024601 [Centaurea solstitialis]